jgi:hypothetical protein
MRPEDHDTTAIQYTLYFAQPLNNQHPLKNVYVFGSKEWSLYTGFTVFELFENLLLLYYWSSYFFNFLLATDSFRTRVDIFEIKFSVIHL